MPPPEAPEKKQFDDIKEAFHSFLCFISQTDSRTVKELNEKLNKITSGSLRPQAPQKIHFDRMNSDDIKKSFLSFSQTIKGLDIQLDKFRAGFLRLGHAKGISSAIEEVQSGLNRTRESFFLNATQLVPDLLGQAERENSPAARRGQFSERFYIRKEYLNAKGQLHELQAVLESLSASIKLLHVRTDEFQEFTAEGARLKDLFSRLRILLSYRALCTQDYIDRLNDIVIQRHIHQFVYYLQTDFENVAAALIDFIAIGIPAIRDEKARAFKILTNILAAAALFSGVTASTLQMSTALSNPNNTILVVNALWFTSLTLSVGAALNCVLYSAIDYLSDKIKPWISSNSEPGKQPPWITWWMKGSHIFLLGASILTFSAGLSVFTFSSNQAVYTPYLIVASMVLASAGLGATLIWIIYKILMAKWQTGAFNPSGHFSRFCRSIAAFIKDAPVWLSLKKRNDPRDKDVEEAGNYGPEKPPIVDQLPNSSDQDGVGSIGRNNIPTALTELILLDEAVPTVQELGSYVTIRNVRYSDDGKWLAIICAIEESYESWIIVLDAKTLGSPEIIYRTKDQITRALKWSPSGEKLIVQFENRCDVWAPAANVTINIELDEFRVQDVLWFDEDAFLITNGTSVIKKDLTESQAQVSIPSLATTCQEICNFKYACIESIGIDRENNYLILFMYKATGEQFILRHTSGWLEMRIVIYDMGKDQKIYEVPLLGDICCATQVPGTLDILINLNDYKDVQLWSLDPGSKDMLKKRTVTPYVDVGPGDNILSSKIGGNRNQFGFSMMKSGNIDIWQRESGKLYRRIRSPMLQKGIQCFSWRRSDDETATFAAAGKESCTLLVWRGEERPVPETSDSPKLAVNEKIRTRFQQTVYKAVKSSSALSVPPSAKEIEEIPA